MITTKAVATTPIVKHDQRPTLLVVDDTPDNLNLIAGLFMHDYQVRVAQDGHKALAICTSDTPPDLLLLDVMMPDMDGFELVRHLRDHPRASRIPVIFITAMTDPASRRQGLELGAVNFVTKPIDPELLQLRVNNQLRHVERHKQLQTDYNGLLALAHLRDDIEQFARDDLKAPLVSILGLVRALLEDGNLLRGQQGVLRLLEQNSSQLLNLLTVSGELCETDVEHFQLQPMQAQIVPMLRRLVEIARLSFKGKDVPLALQDDAADTRLTDREDGLRHFSQLDELLQHCGDAAAIGSRVSIAV
jgi:CheY-like chemotaxis protein